MTREEHPIYHNLNEAEKERLREHFECINSQWRRADLFELLTKAVNGKPTAQMFDSPTITIAPEGVWVRNKDESNGTLIQPETIKFMVTGRAAAYGVDEVLQALRIVEAIRPYTPLT